MLGTGSLFQRIRKVTYIDANITVIQKVEIGRNCIFIDFQCLTHSRYRKKVKFCCLLRANLSTKEISVIMGIALRSVDLKKYRLKQKLNLDANSSLTSYILSI